MPRNEVEGLLELKSSIGWSCAAHAIGTADSMLWACCTQRELLLRAKEKPQVRRLGVGGGRLSRFLNIW